VKLKIYPSPEDTALWFAIQMQRRGDDRTLHNGGYCKEDGSHMRCNIECDGGGVNVTWRSPSTVLMELGLIAMVPCGEDDPVAVEGGKDDREFLLNRVDDGVCKGIKQ
jgi:hypothetical protein